MGFVVGGNSAWCFVIVVLFMGFGGARRWVGHFNNVTRQATKGAVLWGRGASHYVILLY